MMNEPLPERGLDAAILEQMAEALIYCDQSGVIRRWNAAAVRMFGFDPAEAIGQRLDLIIPENLRAAHWRGFYAAVQNGVTRLQGRPTLTKALHKSGSKLYVEMSFALLLDSTRAVLGSVAVARDASERVAQTRATAAPS